MLPKRVRRMSVREVARCDKGASEGGEELGSDAGKGGNRSGEA